MAMERSISDSNGERREDVREAEEWSKGRIGEAGGIGTRHHKIPPVACE